MIYVGSLLIQTDLLNENKPITKKSLSKKYETRKYFT